MKESGKREEEKNFAKGADDDDTGSVVDAALLQNILVKKNTEGYLGLKSLRAEKNIKHMIQDAIFLLQRK